MKGMCWTKEIFSLPLRGPRYAIEEGTPESRGWMQVQLRTTNLALLDCRVLGQYCLVLVSLDNCYYQEKMYGCKYRTYCLLV